LINMVEAKSKAVVYDRAVLDGTLLQVYKSRGYMIQERSHEVMMVKPLTTNAPFTETYGDKFYVSDLDHF